MFQKISQLVVNPQPKKPTINIYNYQEGRATTCRSLATLAPWHLSAPALVCSPTIQKGKNVKIGGRWGRDIAGR
jgi:hypothetical protein